METEERRQRETFDAEDRENGIEPEPESPPRRRRASNRVGPDPEMSDASVGQIFFREMGGQTSTTVSDDGSTIDNLHMDVTSHGPG